MFTHRRLRDRLFGGDMKQKQRKLLDKFGWFGEEDEECVRNPLVM